MDKEEIREILVSRKQIGIRLLYTLFYLIAFEILKTVIQLIVVFQYIYLLITKKHNEPVRAFSNKVSAYAYRMLRYMTLNENKRPFPFSDFTTEIDPPEEGNFFE